MTPENARPHLLVGLTGGIGSGKSTVAQLFEHLGVRIVDTDRISRELTLADGQAIPLIRTAFGTSFIDAQGALDRPRMRRHIFDHPDARKQLEAILHPLIRQQVQALVQQPTAMPYTIIVVPLLVESRDYGWLHRILVVDCSEANQLLRTMQRSQLSEAEARAILAAQASRAERRQRADDLINNDAAPELLPEQVARLHRQYLALTAGSD